MSCRPKLPDCQLSAYYHHKMGFFCVAPGGSGQDAEGWWELQSVEPYLERSCGYFDGRPYLCEWHARAIIKFHQLPTDHLTVHLELNYNQDKPVYLDHV
jgi:hypothetical protein